MIFSNPDSAVTKGQCMHQLHIIICYMTQWVQTIKQVMKY